MAATKRRASSSISPTCRSCHSGRRRNGQNALVSRLLPQLPRHGLGPIASGQHPSVVTKHDQSPGILLDAGSVD
jgi:hypothetical protein